MKRKRRVVFGFLLVPIFLFCSFHPASGARSLELAWAPSTSTNVSGYNVYWGDVAQQKTRFVYVTQEHAVISGLMENASYYFWVTASNRIGLESEPSGTIYYKIPPVPAGIYTGLFYEEDSVRPNSAGSFTVSVTPRATYSGQLRIGGLKYPLTGKLGEYYEMAHSISRPGHPSLTLKLNVGTGQQLDTISGYLSDGTWESVLAGDRALYNSKLNPAPGAGTYTLVMPGQGTDSSVPMGNGYATIKVASSGIASFSGCLSDGTKATQSAPLSQRGQWPFHVPLYFGKGLALSWITFTNQDFSDLDGSVAWIKPAITSKNFTNGFSYNCELTGSAYNPANPLTLEDGLVEFQLGDLGTGFTNQISVGPKGKIVSLGGTGFAMSVASSGLFKGKVTPPGTTRALPFTGVLLQKSHSGLGFLMGTNQSSSVVVH